MRETRDSKGRVRIDDKHSIDFVTDFTWGKEEGESAEPKITPFIVKSTNDEPIPDDEPRMLWRARDDKFLRMLAYYRNLCMDEGATEYQLQSIDKNEAEFVEWQKANPHKMKKPGSTSGR